jgi:hypothetical protein
MVTSDSRDLRWYPGSTGLSDADIRHIPRTWDPRSTTFADPKRISVPDSNMYFVVQGVGDVGPPWLAPVVSAVGRFLKLPDNWDSYGAPMIDHDKVIFGLNLLLATLDPQSPAPTVVPTPSGSVQFEWHRQGMDIEVEVVTAGKINLYYENSTTGSCEESTLASDFRRLATVLHELASRAGD